MLRLVRELDLDRPVKVVVKLRKGKGEGRSAQGLERIHDTHYDTKQEAKQKRKTKRRARQRERSDHLVALPVEEVAEEAAEVGVIGLIFESQRPAVVQVHRELGCKTKGSVRFEVSNRELFGGGAVQT